MNLRLSFILLVVIALVLGGFWFYKFSKNPSSGILNQESPNPVSIPALMEKEFDGRDLKLVKVLESNSAYTRHYITYKSGHYTISGIMNIPKGQAPEGGWPVIFLNHGYIDPRYYTNGRGLRREQDYLARNGFAVVHSDYRGHAESDDDPSVEIGMRLGFVEDVVNAVLAVQKSDLPNISKEKFGMLGHSMGGGISQAIMVMKPDLIDAHILYAPISSDATENFNKFLRNEGDPAAELVASIFGWPEENYEFWNSVSPKTYFERVKSPVLIFHGAKDKSCPIRWSYEIRDFLKSEGKSVELVEYDAEGHEFGLSHTDFMQRSAEFFRTNLR